MPGGTDERRPYRKARPRVCRAERSVAPPAPERSPSSRLPVTDARLSGDLQVPEISPRRSSQAASQRARTGSPRTKNVVERISARGEMIPTARVRAACPAPALPFPAAVARPAAFGISSAVSTENSCRHSLHVFYIPPYVSPAQTGNPSLRDAFPMNSASAECPQRMSAALGGL